MCPRNLARLWFQFKRKWFEIFWCCFLQLNISLIAFYKIPYLLNYDKYLSNDTKHKKVYVFAKNVLYVKETTNSAKSLPGQCSERWIPTHTSLTPSAFQMSQPSIRQDLCIGTMSEYGKFEDHQTGRPRKSTCCVGFKLTQSLSTFFSKKTLSAKPIFSDCFKKKSFLSCKQDISI